MAEKCLLENGLIGPKWSDDVHLAEYGHCISDEEHLNTEDKEALQQKRLKKLRQEKVEWPSDDEILAELKLPKPAPEDD